MGENGTYVTARRNTNIWFAFEKRGGLGTFRSFQGSCWEGEQEWMRGVKLETEREFFALGIYLILIVFIPSYTHHIYMTMVHSYKDPSTLPVDSDLATRREGGRKIILTGHGYFVRWLECSSSPLIRSRWQLWFESLITTWYNGLPSFASSPRIGKWTG